MNLAPQKILQALSKARERCIDADRLAKALALPASQITELRELLKKFEQSGLAAVKGGCYWRTQTNALVIGTLRCTRTGYCFVVPDDELEKKRGDFFIREKDMGAAMQGDKVVVRLTGQG